MNDDLDLLEAILTIIIVIVVGFGTIAIVGYLLLFFIWLVLHTYLWLGDTWFFTVWIVWLVGMLIYHLFFKEKNESL